MKESSVIHTDIFLNGHQEAAILPLSTRIRSYGLIPRPNDINVQPAQLSAQDEAARVMVKIAQSGGSDTIRQSFIRTLRALGNLEEHDDSCDTLFSSPREGKSCSGEIIFEVLLVEDFAVPAEGYRLSSQSGSAQIKVTVSSSAGAQYAATTLLKMLAPEHGSLAQLLGALDIEDAPRFAHRGVMLDVARSYLPLHLLDDLVRSAALLKLNVLHLHLVDDQAWRVEITNEDRHVDDETDYTALHYRSGMTAVAGGDNPGFDDNPETTGANAVHEDPNLGYEAIGAGQVGWYRQEDLRALCDFARDLHITIIPEIEFPGHNHSVLYALPKLATEGAWVNECEGEIQPWTRWQVGYSYLDYDNPSTWLFGEHAMRQYGKIFGFSHLHIGADECYHLIEAVGRDRYDEIVARVRRLAHEVGFETVTVWQEGVRGLDVQPGERNTDRVQLWNYTKPEDIDTLLGYAKDNRARIINSDARHLYLDQKIDLGDSRGLTWAVAEGLPTRNTYEWDPLETIPKELRGAVEGIEACLWGETVRTEEDVTYLMLPRLAAIAEVAWTSQDKRDWADISSRLAL